MSDEMTDETEIADGDIDAVVVAVERDCGRRGKAHDRDGEKA